MRLNNDLSTGNDNLHLLTSGKQYVLRVDLATFEGNTNYSEFNNFSVGSSADNYTLLSLGTYSGLAGKSAINLTYKTSRKDNILSDERNWSINKIIRSAILLHILETQCTVET